jgi:hypothetical protein
MVVVCSSQRYGVCAMVISCTPQQSDVAEFCSGQVNPVLHSFSARHSHWVWHYCGVD